jgi:hypothetical protein
MTEIVRYPQDVRIVYGWEGQALFKRGSDLGMPRARQPNMRVNLVGQRLIELDTMTDHDIAHPHLVHTSISIST